jgi:hypothetical protein
MHRDRIALWPCLRCWFMPARAPAIVLYLLGHSVCGTEASSLWVSQSVGPSSTLRSQHFIITDAAHAGTSAHARSLRPAAASVYTHQRGAVGQGGVCNSKQSTRYATHSYMSARRACWCIFHVFRLHGVEVVCRDDACASDPLAAPCSCFTHSSGKNLGKPIGSTRAIGVLEDQFI